MEIKTLFSETIAHAYIFYKADAPAVIDYFQNRKTIIYEVEHFGIDDSRSITELGNLQNSEEMFVIVMARNLTPEAQHALLKTFEEPKPGIHFLLFVDNPEMLLPTLRSRSICIQKGIAHSGTDKKTAAKSKHPNFLTITLAERFAHIEKIAKSLKKDDPTAFRDAAMEICDAVILELRDKSVAGKSKDAGEQLERISNLRNFLNDRGSSTKQLLETMAMQLPG